MLIFTFFITLSYLQHTNHIKSIWSAGHHKLLSAEIPVFLRFQISGNTFVSVISLQEAKKNFLFWKIVLLWYKHTFYQKIMKIWVGQYWTFSDSYRHWLLNRNMLIGKTQFGWVNRKNNSAKYCLKASCKNKFCILFLRIFIFFWVTDFMC